MEAVDDPTNVSRLIELAMSCGTHRCMCVQIVSILAQCKNPEPGRTGSRALPNQWLPWWYTKCGCY